MYPRGGGRKRDRGGSTPRHALKKKKKIDSNDNLFRLAISERRTRARASRSKCARSRHDTRMQTVRRFVLSVSFIRFLDCRKKERERYRKSANHDTRATAGQMNAAGSSSNRKRKTEERRRKNCGKSLCTHCETSSPALTRSGEVSGGFP